MYHSKLNFARSDADNAVQIQVGHGYFEAIRCQGFALNYSSKWNFIYRVKAV